MHLVPVVDAGGVSCERPPLWTAFPIRPWTPILSILPAAIILLPAPALLVAAVWVVLAIPVYFHIQVPFPTPVARCCRFILGICVLPILPRGRIRLLQATKMAMSLRPLPASRNGLCGTNNCRMQLALLNCVSQQRL